MSLKEFCKTNKLFFAFILLILLLSGNMLWPVTDYAAAAASSEIIYGDVDGNGVVNSLDYALVKGCLLGKVNPFPNPEGNKAADVNRDGSFDSLDLALIRRFIMGL